MLAERGVLHVTRLRLLLVGSLLLVLVLSLVSSVCLASLSLLGIVLSFVVAIVQVPVEASAGIHVLNSLLVLGK